MLLLHIVVIVRNITSWPKVSNIYRDDTDKVSCLTRTDRCMHVLDYTSVSLRGEMKVGALSSSLTRAGFPSGEVTSTATEVDVETVSTDWGVISSTATGAEAVYTM